MNMHMTGVLIAMMVFLILAVGGLMLAVRTRGARQVKDDHPR
jgi:hypothetical protein